MYSLSSQAGKVIVLTVTSCGYKGQRHLTYKWGAVVTSLVLTVWDVLYYLSIAELHLIYLHHSAGLNKESLMRLFKQGVMVICRETVEYQKPESCQNTILEYPACFWFCLKN